MNTILIQVSPVQKAVTPKKSPVKIVEEEEDEEEDQEDVSFRGTLLTREA